jgi:hypothetical protein
MDLENLNLPGRARASCASILRSCAGLPATVDALAVERFAEGLPAGDVRRLGSALAQDPNSTKMDLVFSSADQEAALIVLTHALDFGGGWRRELHAYGGRGAWETVKPGVERLFQACPSLEARWLAAVTDADCANLWRLERISAAALKPFISLLRKVCNDIGEGLLVRGEQNVGEFLSGCLRRHRDCKAPAAMLVADLVAAFPFTFDDRHTLHGHEVCLYKKAQLVVGELYHRFRTEDARFAFVDAHLLTAFIDNVICAVLRKEGVVIVSSELAAAIEAHVPLTSGSEAEVSLRAAAMVGVEEIVRCVRVAGHELTPNELGNWLWGVLGKTPEYRKFTRHVTQDTVFY